MGRFPQRLVAAGAACALLLAVGLAACAEEEEAGTASPTATPARTVTSAVTKTPQATATPVATKTATATAQPSTLTPTVIAATPTPRPAAPTPEPTQQVRQPIWTISQLSGAGQVQIVLEDGLNDAYTVASVDPEVVQWEKWNIESVADLNGDGLVEVIVRHFTGGAHCCFEYVFFSEGPEGIRLDDSFSLGNGAIGTIEDLDGDGVPELDGSDDRLAYFPDLSFAGSPFLPLVLCRSADGTYHDCTPQFSERLEVSAQEFEGYLMDAVQRQAGEEEKRSAALGLLASYMRLDRDDEGWDKVRGLCPECEEWLRQNFGELEQRVRYQHPEPLFPQ